MSNVITHRDLVKLSNWNSTTAVYYDNETNILYVGNTLLSSTYTAFDAFSVDRFGKLVYIKTIFLLVCVSVLKCR